MKNGFVGIMLLVSALPCCPQTKLNRNRLLLMDRKREVTLALSAGPSAASQSCTVYVLEAHGYIIARQGTNDFSCIVERSDADHPEEILPTCYDPEGTHTILPVRLYVAELRSQGKSDDEIDAEVGKGYLNGKFRPPQRAGIAYMLSRDTRYFHNGRVVAWAPHVMIYAPYVTNRDIGAEPLSLDHVAPLPVVGYEGKPYATILVPVRDSEVPAKQ